MSFLDDINRCIHSDARVDGKEKNYLVEERTRTKVQIKSDGQYLLYDFEKIKGLFPFFENDIAGLKSIADNVVFNSDERGNHWVFVIELKNKEVKPNQIYATKQFIDYIIKSINRACSKSYAPSVRGLGYSKQYRPPTNLKKIYDGHKNAYFTGDSFNLSNFRV